MPLAGVGWWFFIQVRSCPLCSGPPVSSRRSEDSPRSCRGRQVPTAFGIAFLLRLLPSPCRPCCLSSVPLLPSPRHTSPQLLISPAPITSPDLLIPFIVPIPLKGCISLHITYHSPGIQFIIYWVFILLSPHGNFSSMRADNPPSFPLYSVAYGRCSECLTDFKSCQACTLVRKVKVKLLSHVRVFATPWTVAYQAPPSVGFSRQEYWSGLPFPSPGDLPEPSIESGSPSLQADTLLSEPPGKSVLMREKHKLHYYLGMN